MARKRGFEVTIRAFVECESSINDMSEAAVRIQSVEQHLMNLGFGWVDIESKFTSRKADEVVPTPMQDLDDSKFPTNAGAPTPAANQAVLGRALRDQIIAPALTQLGADASSALDIPPELDRRVKQIT